ncbi:MAG: hypothetical protein ACYDH4_11640 [Candidatus Cryosericum sp.]
MEHKETDQKTAGTAPIDKEGTRESQYGGKTIGVDLALTGLGFLVLEGLVCLFSQRTDPWHGYLWFALAVVLGAAGMAMLLHRTTRWSTERLLRTFLVASLTVHVSAACLYLWLLFSAGSGPHLQGSLIVLDPALVLVVIFLITTDARSLRALHDPRTSTSAGISPQTWRAVAAVLFFTLVIVLAAAWSFSSSFGVYWARRLATLAFPAGKLPVEAMQRIRSYAAYWCVTETMGRLFLLSIVHASMVLCCSIESPRRRAIAIGCWFALAARAYVPLMTGNASPGANAIMTLVPVLVPFVYALVLSRRTLRALSS